jgi:hypothetical protein
MRSLAKLSRHGLLFSKNADPGKCAFLILLVTVSAAYTECTLHLACANDGQTAPSSN